MRVCARQMSLRLARTSIGSLFRTHAGLMPCTRPTRSYPILTHAPQSSMSNTTRSMATAHTVEGGHSSAVPWHAWPLHTRRPWVKQHAEVVRCVVGKGGWCRTRRQETDDEPRGQQTSFDERLPATPRRAQRAPAFSVPLWPEQPSHHHGPYPACPW
jgi:hypothetical protein